MKKIHSRKIILIFMVVAFCFFTQSCELFVIKGKKIVVEEQAAYSQVTPLGVVTIFTNELANDNALAASELLISPEGRLLNASEKYEISAELSRMKRFLSGKKITNQKLDTLSGTISVTFELDYKNKAIFVTQEMNHLYYILSFDKE